MDKSWVLKDSMNCSTTDSFWFDGLWMSASSLGTVFFAEGREAWLFQESEGGLLVFSFLPQIYVLVHLFLATFTDRKPEQNEMKTVASNKCLLCAPWTTKVHSVIWRWQQSNSKCVSIHLFRKFLLKYWVKKKKLFCLCWGGKVGVSLKTKCTRNRLILE